jgi:hypothetical protein
MNELIAVHWWVCVEALRALRSVVADKNGYYAKTMIDDAANIRSALEAMEAAVVSRKSPQPALTDAEREAIERDLSWLQWCEDGNQIGDVGRRDIATLRGLLERTK